ncbi:hypothetical protein ACH347_17150 [Saccharopolyspora sp. 5N102]|uniref:hypothetical protein n=1 Tax=Saccharopolyspora sp. 5N102 TaxID=3375155 RepID=UPI00378990A0
MKRIFAHDDPEPALRGVKRAVNPSGCRSSWNLGGQDPPSVVTSYSRTSRVGEHINDLATDGRIRLREADEWESVWGEDVRCRIPVLEVR